MFTNKLSRVFARRLLRAVAAENVVRASSSVGKVGRTAEEFFSEPVQDLLKKLTRVDVETIYSARREGQRLEEPSYQFMTSAQYNEVRREAEERAGGKVQMPPVMEPREELESVLVTDPNLVGFSDSKFVFTDVTYGVHDRVRNIVVRDPNGTLREARWEERDRMNQVYFPRPARKLNPSKMFHQPYLKDVLDRGEYLFILDAACCQFEPDDPLYIEVCQQVYLAVDTDSAYNKLRSTRHYGPFMFFLAKNKKIDNLLIENIATDRLEDAVWLIQLFHVLNPDAKSSSKPFVKGKELEFIQGYISEDSEIRDKLDLTLQTYREFLLAPKAESL